MAKIKKAPTTPKAEAPIEDAPVSAEVEAIVNAQAEETPVVTNVVISSIAIADPESVPGPELKLEIAPTIAEQAVAIEEADNVEIIGIRGFEGITGRVAEVRPDGYIVIKATSGTFAAPKANVVKVK